MNHTTLSYFSCLFQEVVKSKVDGSMSNTNKGLIR